MNNLLEFSNVIRSKYATNTSRWSNPWWETIMIQLQLQSFSLELCMAEPMNLLELHFLVVSKGRFPRDVLFSLCKFMLLRTSWNALVNKSSACDPEISSGHYNQHGLLVINSWMKDRKVLCAVPKPIADFASKTNTAILLSISWWHVSLKTRNPKFLLKIPRPFSVTFSFGAVFLLNELVNVDLFYLAAAFASIVWRIRLK